MVNGQDGVKLIYPSTVGGEYWYLDPSIINNDSRFLPNAIIDGDSDLGFVTLGTNAQMWVKTSTGFNTGIITSDVDHGMLASQGFMVRDNDWRDIEMTAYIKFITGDLDTLSISLQCRGANETGVHNCAGTKYLAELGATGKVRFGKKQWHLSQINRDWTSSSVLTDELDAFASGWTGIKFIAYNIGIGDDNPSGAYGVKLELWLDSTNSNTWVKVAEDVDSGGWGNTDNCGANVPADQILSWGGPIVAYNFQSLGEIRFKLLSVRSISPGGDFGSPSVPIGVNVGAIPDATTRVYGSLKMHYRLGVVALPTCVTETPTDPNPPPPPPPAGNVTLIKLFADSSDIIQ